MSAWRRLRPSLMSGGRALPGVRGLAWLGVLLALAGCGGRIAGNQGSFTSASGVECAPYARQLTGLQLYGDAASWWDSAAGRYARTAQPSPGAVLVFRRSGRLPAGHVSVVAALRSPREILVDQANWVHGRIASNEPVLDVSPENDWTSVRVWWAPSGALGVTEYPTFGFIAAAPATEAGRVAAR